MRVWIEVEHQIAAVLAAAGLDASVCARDLSSGERVSYQGDRAYPLASLAKVALAAAVLERLQNGTLDGSRTLTVRPDALVPQAGLTGTSQFRHPAVLAIDDLLYLCVALSDNRAADALFDLVPPSEVQAFLVRRDIAGLTVRTRFAELTSTGLEALDEHQPGLRQSLAIGERTAGGGHRVAQYDVSRTSAGTASGMVDLMGLCWSEGFDGAPLRGLLAQNVVRHRLAPEFEADSTVWASKTGSLGNLRHEPGVVTHDDGQQIALAVLSVSSVRAAKQPAAEAALGAVARLVHEQLRVVRGDLPGR